MDMNIVIISVQSADAATMAEPAQKLRELGIAPNVLALNSDDIDDDVLVYQDVVRHVRNADFIFIRCMSDTNRFKRFEKLEKVLEETSAYVLIFSGNAEVTMMTRHLFRGTDDEFRDVCRYSAARGFENEYGMMHYMARLLGKTQTTPPEPVEQRRDGYYHKGMDRDISREDYLKTLDPSKMTIGILFASSLWLYDNLAAIDALTDEIERRGMNSLPLFYSAVSYKTDGEEGTRATIRKYFTDNGKPIPDAVIIHTSFSVMYNSRQDMGVEIQERDNYYRSLLNVPMLNTLTITGEYSDFENDKVGADKHTVTNNVAFPEIDGDIITVPIAWTPRKSGMKKNVPIPDRIERVVDLAYRWAKLRHMPNSEKKVAILLWQSRPNSGVIGNAAGLDSVESIAGLLRRMSASGYIVENVPDSGRALVDEILDGVTNDLDNMSAEAMRKKAADLVPASDYIKEYSKVPQWDREMTEKDWGDPPGDICVDRDRIIIPGIVKGNVFVGYQPLRGRAEKMEQNIHDPVLFAQHQYLEYYRWIRDVFKADMVIHVGTHGTIEWLPGKNVGMSQKCDPDVVLGGLPNLYIYIVDDPGEGIQCKRRIESVLIEHMPPSMARAGQYDEIAQVERPIQEYLEHKATNDSKRRAVLVKNIYEAAKEHKMLNDIGLGDDKDPGPEGFEPHIVELHEYLSEVKDTLVRADLHVLGRVPKEDHYDEMVYSLMRLDNGDVKSLRDAFADSMGIDIQKAIDDPAGRLPSGELNSSAVDRVDDLLQEFLKYARSVKYDIQSCISKLENDLGKASKDLRESVSFMCSRVVPGIDGMTDEIDNILHGMNGGYVLPGPAGAPTRGNAHILPMGRNFYSLDPDTVPSRASWEIGKKMADQMIEKYVAEKGEFPREVGFIIWATDTMKTGGDDVAYILWLLGVRPVWSMAGGQVIGLEVVPKEELKRPRVDVSVNITGLFRDTFPNLIDLIDDAVKLVAELDESDEDNALAANLRRDIVEGIAEGLTPDEARQRNSVRIFGAPLGGYGTGVNFAIESGAWKTVNDLADVYIDWCSNGYSKGNYGQKMRGEFIRRFSKVGVTVKNMPDREIDLLDCDDVYEYLGGMNAFVRAYGRKDAVTYMGDDSDPKKTKVRSTKDELRFAFRSKVLNPKFINGLKEHGYRGAAEMANLTEYTMAWGATSDVAEDWMYEGLADKFLFDKDTQEWMQDVNPYAMMNILNRLQEAIERGLWNADDEYREELKDLYIKTEERIEEITDR
ncbi:Cobalamin biosynthesis protein CobN-related Mg-chelatase [Thermoplasmatales archaeon BRNA1]|nr:Cobalamin biosynthesis protein CobN-related Mg-chelatase [Thermoplasmatales archaeon BRNA1]